MAYFIYFIIIYCTLYFLVISFCTQTALSGLPQMNPKRMRLISDLITSMNIRRNGIVLDEALVEDYRDKAIAEYFSDKKYRKFVLAFDAHVKPKLTLSYGDNCDPDYASKYKHPTTDVITGTSLQRWVLEHVPANKIANPFTAYCDFTKGLVCNSTTNKCECPPGTSYQFADDPEKYIYNYCFINPGEKCELLDLSNSEVTEQLLAYRLPYLMFNPERPASCSPGTHCRFKAPYINSPRCFCYDQYTNPECYSKTLYWSLNSSSTPAKSGFVDLSELMQLIHKSTLGFVTPHEEETDLESVSEISQPITLDLEGYRQTLFSIDSLGASVPVQDLVNMQTLLMQSSESHCWEDLNPNYKCEAGDPEEMIAWGNKFCNCEPHDDSPISIEDDAEVIRYGFPCPLGFEDSGAVCIDGTECSRWDKTMTGGLCYCPGGVDWLNQATDECITVVENSLVSFIHPLSVAVGGTDLARIQAHLDESDTIYSHGSSNDTCSLDKEKQWAEVYQFFTSIQFHHTVSDALKLGPDKVTIQEYLEKLEDIDIHPIREKCKRKAGFECVHDPRYNDSTEGVCKDILSNDDTIVLSKNPQAKKLLILEKEMVNYEDEVFALFDGITIGKELECGPPPKITSNYSSDTYVDAVTTDVDETGQCVYEDTHSCMEDFSSPEAFTAIWTIKDEETGAVISARGMTKNGEDPPNNPGQQVELVRCESRIPSGISMMCQCMMELGNENHECLQESRSPTKYKNCEKFVLEEKFRTLKQEIIQRSTLNAGADCNYEAGEYVTKSLIHIFKEENRDLDLYLLYAYLTKALNLTSTFCDRKKLLVCGESVKCECMPSTGQRETEGQKSERCYLNEGNCDENIIHNRLYPEEFPVRFPEETAEMVAYYGDVTLGPTALDASGCFPNLCAYTIAKKCVSSEQDLVLMTSREGDFSPLMSKILDFRPLDSRTLDLGPMNSRKLDLGPLVSKKLDLGPLVSNEQDRGFIFSTTQDIINSNSPVQDLSPLTINKQEVHPSIEADKRKIIDGSILGDGDGCNREAEIHIANGISSMKSPNGPDLGAALESFQNALSLTRDFCDRTKLLECGKDGTCVCQPNTDFRRSASGIKSEYCYMFQGPCNQEITGFVPLFDEDEDAIWEHYGTYTNLDKNGCIQNTCLLVKGMECVAQEQHRSMKNGGAYSGTRGKRYVLMSESEQRAVSWSLNTVWEIIPVFCCITAMHCISSFLNNFTCG